MSQNRTISKADWETCLAVLSNVVDDPDLALESEKLERLVAQIYKKARKQKRKDAALNLSEEEKFSRQEQSKEDRQNNHLIDQQIFTNTVIANIHAGKVGNENQEIQDTEQLTKIRGKSKACYCCGTDYREIHFFYHRLCPECAEINYQKRNQRTNLTGRYALVTGGRIKIGFETALKLLRDNAVVMITTRFAKDALNRFSKEKDFNDWQNRLYIQSLDFRDFPALLSFINYLETNWPALDILINNAAQTVRHSEDFYALAIQQEDPLISIPSFLQERILLPENNKNILNLDLLKATNCELDRHGQPIDKRERNSWTLKLEDIEVKELLEVLLINSAAPCLLTAKLKKLFLKSKHKERFVINVCGLDGQFNRASKTIYHPHINMSKAALNMMTRTSSADYLQDSIYMNSVDTGWVTLEGAYSKREQMKAKGFIPPLDEVDAAARIYDPIVKGLEGNLEYGKLFRNYLPTDW